MATIKKACKGVSYPKSSSVSKRLGSPSKAKTGGSFPDLNKDGKITKKDILIGKGVLPKTAKKGMKVSKAQTGKKLSPAPKKKGAMDAVKDLGKYVSTFGLATEKYNPAPSKAAKKTPKNKMGGMTKKCAYGCK